MEANITTGSQLVRYKYERLDKNKKYIISYKAKKISGTERLRCTVRGGENGTYTTLYNIDQNSPTLNVEYSFSQVITGYSDYQLAFYNATGNPVTIGEKTEYYDIMFEEGSVATPYVPYNSIAIKIENKNLFDVNGNVNTRYNGTTNSFNTVNGNDLTTSLSTALGYPYGQKIYAGVGNKVTLSSTLKSITYNLQPSSISGVGTIALYNDNITTGSENINFAYSEIGARKSVTFTASTDYIYATFGCRPASTSATFTDIQVKINSTVTNYIQHQEQTSHFTFEEGQYLAEGDYLADDGIHKVWKQINLADLTWTKRNTNEQGITTYSSSISDRKLGDDLVPYSNKFSYLGYVIGVNQMYDKDVGLCFYHNSETPNNAIYLNSPQSTVENLLTELSGAILQYKLATPIVIPYTPTQQAQWEAIKKMKTYKNVSHISTEGGTLTPSNDVVYYKDLETLFANLA